MKNNKIKKEINDIVNDNLKALEQLFPSAVKDGQLDIKALKEELGDFEEVGIERYELNWAGKQNAKKIVQQGIGNKTLKFVEKDSKNADTTENIYIEGNNLEVLKLLRQNYYNSIKMIYIDPPYNTGNDFVYKDKKIMSKKESDEAERIINEAGEKLEKNLKSTNRYHAKWLSMMYTRLKLARDLLTDDGVIFISIDDNEQANLKRLCDEIFRDKNFVAQMVIDATPKNDPLLIATSHEYMLVYFKNINSSKMVKWGKKHELNDILNDMVKGLEYDVAMKKLSNYYNKNKLTNDNISNYRYVDQNGIFRIGPIDDPQGTGPKDNRINLLTNNILKVPTRGWSCSIETWNSWINDNLILFPEDDNKLASKKTYLTGDKLEVGRSTVKIQTRKTTDYLKKLFDNNKVFSYPKPIELIEYIIELLNINQGIVMDFFSGSGTTAEAVMRINYKNNSTIKYIMVQLEEDLEENFRKSFGKEKKILENAIKFLKQQNKKLKLTEIGKERIRRAGEKIKQEIEEYNSNLKLGEEPKKVPDIGFKVFKVDDTNIKWYDLENFNEESQYSFDDPDSLDFVLGSNDIDIVYEIMLRQNDVPLSERLEVLTDIGNRTYFYASTYLICLETEITEEMVEKLASLEPLPIKFVFRDSAFKDNISLKDETFRKLRSLIERNSGESKVSYRVEFI